MVIDRLVVGRIGGASTHRSTRLSRSFAYPARITDTAIRRVAAPYPTPVTQVLGPGMVRTVLVAIFRLRKKKALNIQHFLTNRTFQGRHP